MVFFGKASLVVFGLAVSAASGLASAQTGNESAQSNNVLINQVHTYSENELLYLDVTAMIVLPAAVREALDNGTQLSFITEIEIYSPRQVLPDKRLAYLEVIKKLSFHALTNKFVVSNLGEDKTHNFASLENALRHLGLYRGVPITGMSLSKSSADSMMRVRIRLLKDSLPWLLYIKSRLPAWSLSSDWYAWHLN